VTDVIRIPIREDLHLSAESSAITNRENSASLKSRPICRNIYSNQWSWWTRTTFRQSNNYYP